MIMQRASKLRALAQALAADGCPARASWQAAQVRAYASVDESKSWIPDWLRSKLPGVAAVVTCLGRPPLSLHLGTDTDFSDVAGLLTVFAARQALWEALQRRLSLRHRS